MLAFISRPRLYRRAVTVLLLLVILTCSILNILPTESLNDPSLNTHNTILSRIQSRLTHAAAGYIPASLRPLAYNAKPTLKEPTRKEEEESLRRLEENGKWNAESALVDKSWKNRLWNLFRHLRLTSSHPAHPYTNRHPNNWDNLPPDTKAIKEWEYARALIYQGSGTRIQRFLEKAATGHGVVVSVIGGSISRGRGLPITPTASSTDRHDPYSADEEMEWVPQGNRNGRDDGDIWHRVPRRTVSPGLDNPFNVHNQIFQFIDTAFPATAAGAAEKLQSRTSGNSYQSSNVFVNGAQGGVGSDYFSECWKEHIPKDSDLVLVDLGINDMRELSSMENYEFLLRSLLEMPSQPAIITLQPFSLLFSTLSGASSLHIDVAAYYDTPVISIRDIVLPRILNDETRKTSTGVGIDVGVEVVKWFRNMPREHMVVGDAKMVFVDEADKWVDLVHMSRHGHSLLAEMVIHYLQTQMEAVSPLIMDQHKRDHRSHRSGRLSHQGKLLDTARESREGEGNHVGTAGAGKKYDALIRADIPEMLLTSHSTKLEGTRLSNSTCHSTSSAFDDGRLSLNFGNLEYEGDWHEYNWGEKKYLVGKKPESRFSFPFAIATPAFQTLLVDPSSTPGSTAPQSIEKGQGYVKIGYLRSNVLGLGSMQCWVEQDKQGQKGQRSEQEQDRKGTHAVPTRVDGWWDIRERNQVIMITIADQLLPGSYTLHCTILGDTLDPGGGTEVRLMAIVYA